VATLSASLVLTVCRLFAPSPRVLVLATALVPFAVLGYAVAALLWWAVRRLGRDGRRLVSTGALLVSVLGLAVHVVVLAPAYVGGHESGNPDLTVLTTNLRLGDGDVGEVTRIAERGDADVVVLEETTPQAFAGLGDLREALPYTAGGPNLGARGTVVLSRYPLSKTFQTPIIQGTWWTWVEAPTPFWLVAVHTSQPEVSIKLWRVDHQYLNWAVGGLQKRGPVVLAGDFNATLDHRPMRDLLGLGYADAARQANSGWQPTWPSDPDAEHGLPFGIGVMAIDHVLVGKQFSTISTRTYRIDGSDHRALLARLAVR
jgi:endonuclease/exonuclease/phosphatase (EEP) superfamily protein YafD